MDSMCICLRKGGRVEVEVDVGGGGWRMGGITSIKCTGKDDERKY